MREEWITSRKNPLLAQIRRLASSRGARRSAGMFLGDGVKLLEEALKWGAPLETVVYSEGLDGPELPPEVRTVRVPEDVMASISPMESPQGALFLCRMWDTAPPPRLEGGRYLVLDGLQDPGNVGTIWRTADALEADGLLLVHGCADPFGPKVVRATMGAVFRCPVWTVGAEELFALLKKSGIPLYGAALREDTLDARAVDYNRCAIAIGSEGRGLTEGVLALCDRTIKIPMSEHCESLNAAAAATVLLWEAARND